MLDSDGSIYLGDFGVSSKLQKGYKRTTLCGSPCWMAPEVVESDKKGYDFSADIWSIGIVAIELALGEPPNLHLPAMKVLVSILKNDPPTLDQTKYSKNFVHFVNSCLVKDPKK